MAGRVALDTSFLIDLQRERGRSEDDGPARTFLQRDPQLELHLSVVALGEFAEGFEDEDHPVLRVVRELHVLLPIDEETAMEYGKVTRRLRDAGRLIGTNDLWIAATSLRHGLPLVTGNTVEFARVDGLDVITYR